MVCNVCCDIYFSSSWSWLVSSAILRVVQDFISSVGAVQPKQPVMPRTYQEASGKNIVLYKDTGLREES